MITNKKQLINLTIDEIKKVENKEEIETLTTDLFRKIANLCNTEKTFMGDRTYFINLVKQFENVPENLTSEYGKYTNHHAITTAYNCKYSELKTVKSVETEEIKNEENTTEEIVKPSKKPTTPKKAPVLDAQKLIDLAVSWLSSDNAYLIGVGIALLTGRRQSEVFFYSSFRADDENTMIVQYLSKKRGENYNLQYRIPVLCNSDLIESAVEKIRKTLPMSELMEIVNNSKDVGKSLQIARAQFNNNYSSQILKIYNNEARQYFADCEDKENKNDKDYFHGIRATYASIMYHLIHEKYQCSVNDSINYVKHCLAHDTDGIAQKYTEFKFKNLPSVDNFDDSIFDCDNINEVPIDNNENVKIEVNLTDLMSRLDVNSQVELSKKLAQNNSIESILALFISKGTQAITISQAVGNDTRKPDSRDKIGNLVLSMLQHNYNQEMIDNADDRIYIAINSSSVNVFSKEVTGKAIDKTTCIETVKKLQDKIDECYSKLDLSKKLFGRKNHVTGEIEVSNLHLRNKAKMVRVVNSIMEIYENQYRL